MADLEASSSRAVAQLSASTPVPPPGAPGTPPPGAPPPGGPWTPSPQQPRHQRSPLPFILAGAGVVIVILVVVLVVVLAGGGDDDESKSASSTETTRRSATSSESGLTRAEEALSAHVPEEFRATCTGETTSADPTPGQVAVLDCDPFPPTKNDVVPAASGAGYIQFDSPDSMNAAYQRALDVPGMRAIRGGRAPTAKRERARTTMARAAACVSCTPTARRVSFGLIRS